MKFQQCACGNTYVGDDASCSECRTAPTELWGWYEADTAGVLGVSFYEILGDPENDQPVILRDGVRCVAVTVVTPMT